MVVYVNTLVREIAFFSESFVTLWLGFGVRKISEITYSLSSFSLSFPLFYTHSLSSLSSHLWSFITQTLSVVTYTDPPAVILCWGSALCFDVQTLMNDSKELYGYIDIIWRYGKSCLTPATASCCKWSARLSLLPATLWEICINTIDFQLLGRHVHWGKTLFDPLLIFYVCPLTKKLSFYNFNGRFIWTVRDRITTQKSRKTHFKKVINWFAF